jgi:hypothetical protein
MMSRPDSEVAVPPGDLPVVDPASVRREVEATVEYLRSELGAEQWARG